MKSFARASWRFTPAQRRKILAAFERSALSQREFAAQAGIGVSTLALWLRKAAVTTEAPSKMIAVPNVFGAAAIQPPAYRLQLPGGLSVEVAAVFRAEELRALLQVLQAL